MEMTIFLYDVALPTRLQCERGVVDRGAHEASTLQPCKACAFLIRHPYKVSRPLFYLLFYKYMHQHPGPYITCLCHKPLYSLQP